MFIFIFIFMCSLVQLQFYRFRGIYSYAVVVAILLRLYFVRDAVRMQLDCVACKCKHNGRLLESKL